jgi:hypothetical protein
MVWWPLRFLQGELYRDDHAAWLRLPVDDARLEDVCPSHEQGSPVKPLKA